MLLLGLICPRLDLLHRFELTILLRHVEEHRLREGATDLGRLATLPGLLSAATELA